MKNHYVNIEGIVLKRGGGGGGLGLFTDLMEGLVKWWVLRGVILRGEEVDTSLQTIDLTLTY